MKKLLFILVFIPLVSFGQNTQNEGLAEKYFQEGKNYNKNNDLNKAIESYTNSLKFDQTIDGRIASYFNRAAVKYKLGDYKSARDDYDSVITMLIYDSRDPKDIPNLNLLFQSYLANGLCANNMGDYKTAISDYSMALEVRPNSSSTYFNRGISKNKLGDFSGAISDLSKAVEINSKYAEAFAQRGIIRTRLEDYLAANSDFTKAIDINPAIPKPYYFRALSSIGIINKSQLNEEQIKKKMSDI